MLRKISITPTLVTLVALLGSVALAGEEVFLAKDDLRVRFAGDLQSGYDVDFQKNTDNGWVSVGRLPKGETWTVYADWQDSWYAEPVRANVQTLEELGDGRIRASADVTVAGHRWQFVDVYSLHDGLVKIQRSWKHLDPGRQEKITLASCVRMPFGDDPRMLVPGTIYNGNPSSTLPGPQLSFDPGTIGLYEEHRLPVPMVNAESTLGGRRLHGSLLAVPSKIPQGHKGDDHWWSMGLRFGEGYVDLLSLSGPVATNGKRSTIYGHRNGFDPYDDAYLDVQGPTTFRKTLYLDLGQDARAGYSFRNMLWKAHDILGPIESPHLPFAQVMDLKTRFVKTTFLEREILPEGNSRAVVRFGKVQIVDGDSLTITRLDGRKDTYKFYATGKTDPYSSSADPDEKIIGIEIVEPDAWFLRTVDRVIDAINANEASDVVAEPGRFLAPNKESWGMRLVAKRPGTAGDRIELSESAGKIEFTSNLKGPWGLMGTEPKTTHLVGGSDEPVDAPVQRSAGYCWFPGLPHFQYAWCGGNLAIAYAMLSHAERTGDEQARHQALATVEFFLRHAETQTEGLHYGDYNAQLDRWYPANFHGFGQGISSRQFGENLYHLADLVMLAKRLNLDVPHWEAALRKSGDFLVRSPRYKRMYPRAWTLQGASLGYKDGKPTHGRWLSTAGVFCVSPLVQIWQITGDKKYLDCAVDTMEGYWEHFGEDQSTPFWGVDIDAASEDMDAGWAVMRAALDVYEATGQPRYLDWARDAADWTLTWTYFHNVGMPADPELDRHLNTVGWTAISAHNQEIDVWGYFMAPDFYRLGLALEDERYCHLGKLLFDACTQTITREGAMFGQTQVGIQAEHYNHTNCTYVTGGRPRGSQHGVGISWVVASTLYGGTKLAELAPEKFRYETVQRQGTGH